MRHFGKNLKDLLESMESSKLRQIAKEESHTKLKKSTSSIKPRFVGKMWSFAVSVFSSPNSPKERSGTAVLYEAGEDFGKSCIVFCMGSMSPSNLIFQR